ncbi:mitochondrial 54S ribosomal protein bL32m [Magnusiomyces paraingens]|uniref:Large ribosomal subunit protein bL32m n=1 Tax=Magnusiomyces paraingens TaxID=2606893 RepID=A0A5E8C1Z3_9ASCO|nr:uncharacterized protein SAPINGB_P005477 [Saprochaete ingens]VVT56990.1 unnamed protein product [Saprochaete ingens]
MASISLKAFLGGSSRLLSVGSISSSSAAGLPGIIPRLTETLRNIPPITIQIPFGNKKTETEVRGDMTGLDEHGCSEVTPASIIEENKSSRTKGGVTRLGESFPDEYFFDNGILLAVPKKKVSHRRKRNRQIAPEAKQQKEVFSLDRCSSCGHIKRRHALCMHCVSEIKTLWKERDVAEQSKDGHVERDLLPIEEQTLYPGKVERAEQKKLKEKEYLYKPPRTLPYEK